MAVLNQALLRQLRAELRTRDIAEAPIKAKGWHLDGLYDPNTDHVYVDPAPTVAEVLMHELLHRRFPKWGEKRVDATARRLLRSMTTRQVQWWKRQYQLRKTTMTTPVSAD